jgi:HEPN domain-containing protein
MSVTRRITAFLDLEVQDVDAAKTLASTRNRYAAYHCQQAAEKLIKADFLGP